MTNETDLVNVKVFEHPTNETFIAMDVPDFEDSGSTTQAITVTVDPTEPGVIPDAYIWCFLSTIVLIGFVMNVLAIFALLRAKCNGTRYFLLQLSFCDIGTLSMCGLELFYMNYRKWQPTPELCPVYLGMESFTNTATIYFIVAINLHALSTYNLALKTIRKRIKIEHEYSELSADHTDDDNDNYEIAINVRNRSLTIDYSQRKNSIAVIIPAIIIWLLAASISIPLFVFGYVIPNDSNPMICGVVNFDNNNNRLMQAFVLIIRLIIPSFCLYLTSILVIVKIFLAKTKIRPCGLDENVILVLKVAIVLSVTFLVFSMQKICGSLLFEVISQPFMHYKYPHMDRLVGIAFSMISFILPALRPTVYFWIDTTLRRTLTSCCRRSVRESVEGQTI